MVRIAVRDRRGYANDYESREGAVWYTLDGIGGCVQQTERNAKRMSVDVGCYRGVSSERGTEHRPGTLKVL